MPAVELQTAYRWCCPSCGEENFALPRKMEFTDDSREDAYRHFHELDEWSPLPDGWEQFEMVHLPDEVTCQHCQGRFTTTDERDSDE